MTETLHEIDGEPTTAFTREAGVVELRTLHERDAAIVRVEIAQAELKDAIGVALREIADAGREAAVAWAGPPFVRYLSWGGPRLVAEVGVPVTRPMPHLGRVESGRLPGGTVASVIHVGPYETIAATYGQAMQRIGELGHAPTGPMWEVYWSDPSAEPDPSTWRTEILIPVS